MTVAHIITGLDDGGAEAVLYRLCVADSKNSHVVISLLGDGKYGPLLSASGVNVHCLEMPRGSITFGGILKLIRLLREIRPDVVQTWMYHADLLGGLAARAVGIRQVYWGLHHTILEKSKAKRSTIMVARFNALLSRWIPRRIVSCSQKGVLIHQALGYAKDKFEVIPNGYDLQQFSINPQLCHELKLSLSLPDDVPLFGMVGRFDPNKDHLTLIAALGLLKQEGCDFRCVLVGSGMSETNIELMSWLDKHAVRDRVVLLGQRNDIPAIMNMIDVHVLSSNGEAFPNVLCEAMACGTPCVTTDVGDAALIVGDTGWVTAANSSVLLSQTMYSAFTQLLTDTSAWEKRQNMAVQRIRENFSIDSMVDNYIQVWSDN